jgi:hypothetical protein
MLASYRALFPFIFLIVSRFSSKMDRVVPSLLSCSESVSSLIFFSTSWIFRRIVASKEVSAGGLGTSNGDSPSFMTITRFWQLTHHKLPPVILKRGEEHAGQESSVRIAPWRSKSAMAFMFFLFLDNCNPHKDF